MARHKVYVEVRPWSGVNAGTPHSIGSRAKITEYDIAINADTNIGDDIVGSINITHDNGEVCVTVSCPNYHVKIAQAESLQDRR